jgi:hypothetical protein
MPFSGQGDHPLACPSGRGGTYTSTTTSMDSNEVQPSDPLCAT